MSDSWKPQLKSDMFSGFCEDRIKISLNIMSTYTISHYAIQGRRKWSSKSGKCRPIISVHDMVKIVSSTSLYSSDFTAVARRIVTTVWLRHNLWLLLPHNVLLQVSRLVIPLINQEIYLILRFHLASLK